MYTCLEVTRALASDEYRQARFLKKLGIRLHLAMCKYCSRYARQLRTIAAALRVGRPETSPAEVEAAKHRILKQLSRNRENGERSLEENMDERR